MENINTNKLQAYELIANYYFRLGCFNFTHPSHLIEGPSSNPVSRSLFFPDAAISSHPRFP